MRDDVTRVRDDDGAERGGGKGHVRSAHTFEERELRNARAGSRVPPSVYVPYCALMSHWRMGGRQEGRKGGKKKYTCWSVLVSAVARSRVQHRVALVFCARVTKVSRHLCPHRLGALRVTLNDPRGKNSPPPCESQARDHETTSLTRVAFR